jgi:hypothetical protein
MTLHPGIGPQRQLRLPLIEMRQQFRVLRRSGMKPSKKRSYCWAQGDPDLPRSVEMADRVGPATLESTLSSCGRLRPAEEGGALLWLI